MAEKFLRVILTYADEFHHAVNDLYRRIVDYFKPQFLLGLTATPERMDGRNIYNEMMIIEKPDDYSFVSRLGDYAIKMYLKKANTIKK